MGMIEELLPNNTTLRVFCDTNRKIFTSDEETICSAIAWMAQEVASWGRDPAALLPPHLHEDDFELNEEGRFRAYIARLIIGVLALNEKLDKPTPAIVRKMTVLFPYAISHL